VPRAGEVDLHVPVPELDGLTWQRTGVRQRHPRVRDHDVEAPVLLAGGPDGMLGLDGVGDIPLDEARARAGSGDHLVRRHVAVETSGQRRVSNVAADDPRSFAGEPQGGCASEAARRA